MRKLKNGKGEVTGEIWRLCNMAFENSVAKDWRSFVILPLYKGKAERTE